MGRFIAALESLGYNVAHDITDMSLYGIPQKDDASPYWLPEFRQLPCLNPQKK